MKDIFSELYKKVLSFFNNEAKEENSKDTACNRLKLVLMQDRAKMEPALMEKMREEMVAVISKYVEIDKEALDLNLEAEGESFALMLNIPVLRAKTREEVEAAEGIISKDDDDDDDIEENSSDDVDSDEEETSEEVIEEESTVENEDVVSEDTQESESVEETSEEDDDETQDTEPASSVISDEVKEKPSSPVSSEQKSFKKVPLKNKIKNQKDDDL